MLNNLIKDETIKLHIKKFYNKYKVHVLSVINHIAYVSFTTVIVLLVLHLVGK